jgi:hypothetical protein
MRVVFHPEFARDVKRFRNQYAQISEGLAARFRQEIDDAMHAIKLSPSSAGHFLQTESTVIQQLRRRNLRAFPHFVLYAVRGEEIFFGSVVPSRSDPLTWLLRFRP